MKRQIKSNDLPTWLAENGGLNALYQPRERTVENFRMKTLHLNQPVTVPKSGEFTITLNRDPRGFFDVVGGAP